MIAAGVTFAAAAIGTVASVNARSFYADLSNPTWAPPGWLFGPVWTVLYTMMAIAAWLVWRAAGIRRASVALQLYSAQLAANALWSWCFFAWRDGALAFANIVLLLVLILATMASFWRVQRVAAALLLPYLIWVSFATALSYTTWQRNPGLLG